MAKKLPFCKITIEFPFAGKIFRVALFKTIKNRRFKWRYNGKMRGEITPTELAIRLCRWIGGYDEYKESV